MAVLNWIRETSDRYVIYSNTIFWWLIALAVFFGVALLLRLLKTIADSRVRALAKKRRSDWATAMVEVVQRTRLWFLLALALYSASLVLVLPERTTAIVQSVAVITLLLQAAIWGSLLLTFSVTVYTKRRLATDAAAVTTIGLLSFIGKLVLWVVVVLLALDNVGVDVTALVAGLGISGIAVALAAQNILGDLFASISIVLDKPFARGDFIATGDFMGTVELIGLKTTRLRSLSGEELILCNNDLLQSRIRNHKRMLDRRAVFSVGVTYQTPPEKVAVIPNILREIVESQKLVRFDRAHFQSLGDSALRFEVVYFVLSADFNVYMDIQQDINLELVRRFDQEQIDFAYPTQTVVVQRAPGARGAAP